MKDQISQQEMSQGINNSRYQEDLEELEFIQVK